MDRGRLFAAGVFVFLLWAVFRYIDLFAGVGGMLGASLMFFALRSRAVRHGPLLVASQGDCPCLRHPSTPGAAYARTRSNRGLVQGPRTSAARAREPWPRSSCWSGMIALRSIPFFGGKTVLLKVQPVDPRDMFRGDYVTLSYEFSIAFRPREFRDFLRPRTERIGQSARENGLRLAGPGRRRPPLHGGGYSLTPPASGLSICEALSTAGTASSSALRTITFKRERATSTRTPSAAATCGPKSPLRRMDRPLKGLRIECGRVPVQGPNAAIRVFDLGVWTGGSAGSRPGRPCSAAQLTL